MADAMCGPSNALQQFKQQTDVDRTLHQDRLTSRRPPGQDFRSHNPQAAHLDPEFEAFQAGVEPALLDHIQPLHPQGPATFATHSNGPSWAADFQRLNISTQPTQQQQPPHFRGGASPSAWAQGFREHIAQNAPMAHHSSSISPQAFQQRARGYGNLSGFQSHFSQSSYAAPVFNTKGKEPVVAEQFDEAAFERAFDRAREDMMADVEDTDQQESVEELVEKIEGAAEHGATQMLNETTVESNHMEAEDIMQRIHNSDIEYDPDMLSQEETMNDRQPEQRQHDDDALAATAHELLEKVEHNQSDKFRNSQFLSLMRKLRDREVRVEGDKMVETVSHTYAPQSAHPHTPAHSSDTCKVPNCHTCDHDFDHWESPYS